MIGTTYVSAQVSFSNHSNDRRIEMILNKFKITMRRRFRRVVSSVSLQMMLLSRIGVWYLYKLDITMLLSPRIDSNRESRKRTMA